MPIAHWWMQFDLFVLDRCFQRFSDWAQELTGRSCFWSAKWTIRCMCASILIGTLWIARDVYMDPVRVPLLVAIVAMAYIMEPHKLFQMSVFLDEYEHEILGELEAMRTANPYRLKFARRRFRGVTYSVLGWSVVLFAVLLLNEGIPLAVFLQAFLILYTVATYFMSCTPKPRSGQKQHKLALSPT